MVPPTHFGSYLSPIQKLPLQEEQESFHTFNQEAMEPLTLLPEVDSMPLVISREKLKHPPSPFQPSPSAEDLSILSGIAPSEDSKFTSTNQSWSGKVKALLWSLGAGALAALSGASDDGNTSSNISSTAAMLDQWPSSDHLYSLNTSSNSDEEWENVEEDVDEIRDSSSGVFGFSPFSSSSFTFASAEPPEPLLWD